MNYTNTLYNTHTNYKLKYLKNLYFEYLTFYAVWNVCPDPTLIFTSIILLLQSNVSKTVSSR